MAASNTFNEIGNEEAYRKWQVFCVEALGRAKAEISKDNDNRFEKQREGLVNVLEKLIWWIAHFGVAGIVVLTFLLSLGPVAFGTTLFGSLASLGVSLISPIGLAAGVATGAVGALAVKYVRYLYSQKVLTNQVLRILKEMERPFHRHQPGYSVIENRLFLNRLFKQSVVKVMKDLYGKRIMLDDYSLPIHPICVCGNELVGKRVSALVESIHQNSIIIDNIKCGLCNQILSSECDVYHCHGHYNDNQSYYDVCVPCARKFGNRMKRYHAFVIFDSIGYKTRNDGNYKDGDVLYDFFKNKLCFHSVKMLKGRDVTKKNIFDYLQSLSRKESNDVVVIFYCGHGNNSPTGFKFCTSDGDFTDKDFQFHLLANHSNPNNFDIRTKDILVMLNACRSGAFNLSSAVTARNPASNGKESNDELVKHFAKKLKKMNERLNDIRKSTIVISATKPYQDAIPATVSPFVECFI